MQNKVNIIEFITAVFISYRTLGIFAAKYVSATWQLGNSVNRKNNTKHVTANHNMPHFHYVIKKICEKKLFFTHNAYSYITCLLLFLIYRVAELPSCRHILGSKNAKCPVTYENSCNKYYVIN